MSAPDRNDQAQGLKDFREVTREGIISCGVIFSREKFGTPNFSCLVDSQFWDVSADPNSLSCVGGGTRATEGAGQGEAGLGQRVLHLGPSSVTDRASGSLALQHPRLPAYCRWPGSKKCPNCATKTVVGKNRHESENEISPTKLTGAENGPSGYASFGR
jgi:hypothetical protein